MNKLEPFFLRIPIGIMSRFRVLFYKLLGMALGTKNRFEKGRCRRINQIKIGDQNAFTQGYMLWPIDENHSGKRIIIGNKNYFNRNLMLDACGTIEIGDYNMFGPDVYITDSNHTFGSELTLSKAPMNIGKVKIGNNCWIGAKAIILKDVELGDGCVVAAGAVVTKGFPAGSIIAGVPAKIIK